MMGPSTKPGTHELFQKATLSVELMRPSLGRKVRTVSDSHESGSATVDHMMHECGHLSRRSRRFAGSRIGGLTSVVSTWLMRESQAKAGARASDNRRRQKLYKRFIEDASRLNADALERDQLHVADLVRIDAMISMRVLCSPTSERNRRQKWSEKSSTPTWDRTGRSLSCRTCCGMMP
jgi:hypothetical protein